jgi:hypothetical protein
VKLSAYRKYFNAGASVPILVVMSIAFLATQGLFVYADKWLSKWYVSLSISKYFS